MSDRVLLAISNLKSIFGDPNAVPGHPHTGVAYLSAFLKSKGVQVDLYDERMDGAEKLPELLKNNYAFVGITAFSYSLRNVYSLIERVKSLTQSPVVLGGPHVSVSKLSVLRETSVDFAVKHEGEYTVLDLLEALRRGDKDFAWVQGLLWRNGGDVVENPDRPVIANLEELPYPDYESFQLERYPCFDVKALPFLTQRGCPYKCNFCSVPVSMGSEFRVRSPQDVVKELKHWNDKGWKHFQFNDDVFNFEPKRALEVAQAIVESGLQISWELYNGMRVNAVNEELLAAMKKSGCRLISYGCESGSPRILRVIRKGLTIEMVSKAVKLTHEAGISCSVNFIVGHPTETFEEAKMSLAFAESLPASFINFYNDTPYPGTELYEWVKANARMLHPEYLTDHSYNSREPIYDTPEFPKEQRMVILAKGRDLYERSVLRYRLGPLWGRIAFLLSRSAFVNEWGRRFVTNTRLGHYLFSKMSVKFGGMVWVR